MKAGIPVFSFSYPFLLSHPVLSNLAFWEQNGILGSNIAHADSDLSNLLPHKGYRQHRIFEMG